MINHFKAEFYKLRHSKILITILGVCAAVIMVSFALGDMTFFGAGDGTESVIGFQAKCYLSSEIPTFQTVARSSLAYTALERFYVADVSRSNGTSGQGLYIVKKLLLMMNCTNPIIEIHDHNFMITIDFSPLLIKK